MTKHAGKPRFWTLRRRRYLYGIAVAAVPLVLSRGWATPAEAVQLLALSAAVLGVAGTALAHPTPEADAQASTAD